MDVIAKYAAEIHAVRVRSSNYTIPHAADDNYTNKTNLLGEAHTE